MSDARELNKEKSKPWIQENFGRGLVKNAPHEDIPEGAIAGLKNAHAFPTEIQPRGAARLHSDLAPPVLTDDEGNSRSGLVATKTGNIITCQDGEFTEADVQRYFVWPGDEDYHDLIIEYISATQVRTRDSGDRGYSYGCWMHEKMCLWVQHRSMKEILWQWGRELYVARSQAMSSRDKVLILSYDTPFAVHSDWDELNDYGLIANSNGLFHIDWDQDYAYAYRRNCNVPAVLPESIVRTADHKYRYDYTYSMSRLSGSSLRQRTSEGVKILLETGTCALNPNTTPARDYGIRWTTQKIDSTVKTQGRLVGGEMAAAQQSVDYWTVTVPVPGASFRLTINDRTENFLIDFGPTGFDCHSMADVAAAIQETIRTVFTFATCEYHQDGYFIFTSGEQDGSTIDWGTAGTGGTNVAALMLIRNGDGGTLNNLYPWAAPHTLGTFDVPRVATSPNDPEWHYTHYTIYRTTDIGPLGVDVRVNESTGEELPPLKFTWIADIRVSGAFYGYKDSTGLVTVLVGSFEEWDVGTTLEWENGDIDTIRQYVSEVQVYVTSVSTVETRDYYDAALPLQAIAIGGGLVFRASQDGYYVTNETVYNTNVFERSDERKTITWADGTYSIILEYINDNTVRVHDSETRPTQGVTFDALSRNFTDSVSDITLRDRQGELHIGLLEHRFREALPNCNILETVPGALMMARRNESTIYYQGLPVDKTYLAGYYLPNRQKIDRVKSPIQTIIEAPNKFLIICSDSLWGGPTNNITTVTIPEFGDRYIVLQVDPIDKRIGIVDTGSIREVDFGVYEARCTDNAVRQFTPQGFIREFGDFTVDSETGQDKIKNDITLCWQESCSCYMDKLGWIWWGRKK